ncbi:SnoaL-like domain protein [Actinomadura rubteroloni]|uniref:SnoaL-like domain protein n=1 Tax=Actinomadura rubteroloni TaxID=1926885 RepID=A0A2P4UER2_9ACTN|nr:nuclear transport factor 2 family protein [Actinomadura rubteroloni]POM23502.1 SnoaL-like domain protein [Actinomadura rubteroloni]
MRSARELWEAAYKAVEAADDDALRDLCSADIEIRTSAKQQRGPDALAGLFAQQRGLYTGLEKAVDGVIESADGRAMAAELTLSGLPNGTDERLTWGVVETIRADGDRLVSWHAMLDRTWLVQQIRANQR